MTPIMAAGPPSHVLSIDAGLRFVDVDSDQGDSSMPEVAKADFEASLQKLILRLYSAEQLG